MRRRDLLARIDVQLRAAGAWLWVAVAGWAALVYLIVNFVVASVLPDSLNIYVAQPLLWASLALMAFIGWEYGIEDKPRLSKALALAAILTGAFQVSLFIIAGLLFGFGYSPYSHQPLAVLGNLVYVGSVLVGTEMSRACLVSALGRRGPILALVSASLFFSLVSTPVARLTSIADLTTLFRVSGDTFLPTVSENLLASFLALLGGPVASIAYRGTLQAFEWLSPILPNLRWTVTAFLGTVAPALGLLVVRSVYLPEPASKARMTSRDSTSPVAWMVVAVVGTALLWFNTGLLGVRPTLVIGVSMEPTMMLGDVAITQDVSPEDVEVGDIIRYGQGNSWTLHRVAEVLNEPSGIYFITRGDANNVDDPPVPASDLGGKVIFVVPKIGWVAIGVRRLIEWLA